MNCPFKWLILGVCRWTNTNRFPSILTHLLIRPCCLYTRNTVAPVCPLPLGVSPLKLTLFFIIYHVLVYQHTLYSNTVHVLSVLEDCCREEKKEQGGGIGDSLPRGQTCTRWRKQPHINTHTHTHAIKGIKPCFRFVKKLSILNSWELVEINPGSEETRLSISQLLWSSKEATPGP